MRSAECWPASKRTHDEVDWSGTDPAAPTSDGRSRTILRGEVLRTWLLSFGLTAVLLCAETYVMMRNVTIFIHGETPTFSLILALVLALIMTTLPHAVGAAVITSRRRGEMKSREKLTIFLLTPVWLTIGVLVGLLRTFATQRLAVLAAADHQEIPLDKVDVAVGLPLLDQPRTVDVDRARRRLRAVRGEDPDLQPVPGPGRQARHRHRAARVRGCGR